MLPCEKLVEELASKDGWVREIPMPVHGLDHELRLGYRVTKNAPESEPEPEETRPRKSPRRKSSQPQSTDT